MREENELSESENEMFCEVSGDVTLPLVMSLLVSPPNVSSVTIPYSIEVTLSFSFTSIFSCFTGSFW